ncbi:MAG: YbjN domain-containing protein [Bifidobacteriaceae bacterium]|nr:YbjN domain-containing protein [Bifidobacteriaceae bacterium]
MGNLDQLRGTIQRHLQSVFNQITIDSDGDFSAQLGSSRLFIRPETAGSDDDAPTIVSLWVILLRNVADSPELYEHIAFHADDYRFGHLSLHRADDGSVTVLFTHQLLGDYLDEAELGFAATAMLHTADGLDDKLQAQFGGTLFHER